MPLGQPAQEPGSLRVELAGNADDEGPIEITGMGCFELSQGKFAESGGFFGQDVFAGIDSLENLPVVGVGRAGDDDGIDERRFEHLGYVRENDRLRCAGTRRESGQGLTSGFLRRVEPPCKHSTRGFAERFRKGRAPMPHAEYGHAYRKVMAMLGGHFGSQGHATCDGISCGRGASPEEIAARYPAFERCGVLRIGRHRGLSAGGPPA